MSKIKTPTKSFKFDNFTLSHPTSVQGGSYFTKLNDSGETLYIQIPKCLTKQGIVQTEKKMYCDLMFTKDDEDAIEWFETLEKNLSLLIYNKRKTWFDNDLDLEDIENMFASPIRLFKSGKFYLIRVNILYNKNFKKAMLPCYNNESKEICLEELTPDKYIIPILEIQGVKFNSNNFQIEIVLKQIMILNPVDNFNNCLINVNNNNNSPVNVEEKTNQESNNESLNVSSNNEVVDASSNEGVGASNNDVLDSSNNDVLDSSNNDVLDSSNNDVVDASNNDVVDASNNDVVDASNNEQIDLDDSIDDLTLSDDDIEGTIKEVISNNENKLVNSELYDDDDDDSYDDDDDDDEDDDDDDDDDEEGEDVEDDTNKKFKNLLDNDKYLEEINLGIENVGDTTIKLKNPKDVYYEIWKKSRAKAKKLKRQALEAYLDSKNIKSNYMINDIDNSDDELDTFIDKIII